MHVVNSRGNVQFINETVTVTLSLCLSVTSFGYCSSTASLPNVGSFIHSFIHSFLACTTSA